MASTRNGLVVAGPETLTPSSGAVPARNLEVKARCADLAAAEAVMRSLGATSHWTTRQVDTYFHVPRGRLKLREHDDRPGAELIGYERPDHGGARESAYRVVHVPDAAAMKATLAGALGVRVVVAKRRTLYTWHNVRVHLDAVEGLGTFIEFEAVLRTPEDEAASPARVAHLAELLDIHDADRIAGSYSDLLARS
jgi:predicted adenylyl cyclase CyaB